MFAGGVEIFRPFCEHDDTNTPMTNSDEIITLLTEIRDAERDHFLEYKRVTTRSLELQQEAVGRQAKVIALYKRALIFSFCLVAFILILIVYLLTKIR